MRQNNSLLEKIANKAGLAIGTALLVYATSQTPTYAEVSNKRQNKEYIISKEGINLIKQYEGYSGEAYRDRAGNKTIGYGHLLKKGENYIGVSKEKAEILLNEDLREAERAVNELVNVKLTQSQYNALVSFVFNLGRGNFAKSTLLKKLNSGDFGGAGNEFLRWKFAGGKVVKGLLNRRQKEKELFER